MQPFFSDISDVAERVIWKQLNLKNFCSIAKVTKLNTSPVSVNIQPLVNYFDQNAGYQEYPELEFIPIAQMQQATYSINLPVNVGDTGIVLWFDREAYTTLLQASPLPKNPSSGDMTDSGACVFIPILPFFSKAKPLITDGVDVMSKGVSLLNQLILLCTKLDTLITDIKAITVPTGTYSVTLVQGAGPAGTVGPGVVNLTTGTNSGTPNNSASFTTVATDIAAIKTDLIKFLGGQP